MPLVLKKIAVLELALMILALSGGCSGMRKFNVVVTADQSISNKTVEVDLVAVNQSELEFWRNIKLSEYWARGNPTRQDTIKYTIRFGPTEQGVALPPEQTLKKSNEVWKQWKANRATHLFVLAHLPGIGQDLPGAADPRRLILPLESRCWGSFAGTLDIVIMSSRISCLNQWKTLKCPPIQ